ncbi:hypothetical protein [Hymenobacter psychrophilus]|uniref:PsbP protein n=1 Tax=Hymenobacter psychrophilus TaxID=651662 RepID=A0A1H3BML9_9BACT|nr:hypothetical protein [Hymenobacter psychrophilus]SDX43222.1 hypothetical protein SAMN04488069_101354 [Hymenobacter psychrophilus]
MRCFLLFLLLMTGLGGQRPAQAQELETIQSRKLQLKFRVPADWRVERLRTDSLYVMHYTSPDQQVQFWVGELRGIHATLPPSKALQRLLNHLGATEHEEHPATSAGGLTFLESTGTARLRGRQQRYVARVADNQGHLLLVYLYATPKDFGARAPLLDQVLNSLAPLPR